MHCRRSRRFEVGKRKKPAKANTVDRYILPRRTRPAIHAASNRRISCGAARNRAITAAPGNGAAAPPPGFIRNASVADDAESKIQRREIDVLRATAQVQVH